MHLMHKVVRHIMCAIGTEKAEEAVKLLDQKKFGDLVKLDASPLDYDCSYRYHLDAQLVALTRKLEGLPTGVDLKAEAVSSFWSCEAQNEKTNHRLALYLNWFERGFIGDHLDERLYLFLKDVRRVISRILGPAPKDLTPRFSAGSTYYDRGEKITILHKMESAPSVTPKSYDLVAGQWTHTQWAHCTRKPVTFVAGNRFTTVPKDSKKHRGICVEPSLNIAYQLSVGLAIKQRLSRVGIQIDGRYSAQGVHRDLARESSITGACATIDLSNASDTISFNLVKLLLPKRWFNLLDSLRSPYTKIGDTWHKNQKFSSMGNGYTFELETLIFFALATVLNGTNENVSVYGDDIIVPEGCVSSLKKCLSLFGLTPNMAKSFSGAIPFRESCGGDFWNGVPVRPVFLKKIPSNPQEWIVLHNNIRRIAEELNLHSEHIGKALSLCRGEIPKSYRLYGPPTMGDSCLHDDNTDLWITRERHLTLPGGRKATGIPEICVVGTIARRVKLCWFQSDVQLVAALLGAPSQGPTPRDGISGFKRAWQVLL